MKLLVALAVLKVAFGQNETDPPTYSGCDVDTYYADFGGNLASATKAQLRDLLTSTHRAILPVRNDTGDDIYGALIDLDAGPPNAQNEPTVKLAFRDIFFDATPNGNINTWQRGNIWPEDKRTNLNQRNAEDTDIFINYPVDVTVFATKENSLFGFCGTVQEPELCLPLPEANQTYTDGKIWQPTPSIRGDQARALMYMATRYSIVDENGTEIGLQLADCPPYGLNEYGLLSAILEAHANDPPTEEEIARNERACSRWQGNRNPYIDEPSLATSIFGQPDTIREGFRAYEKCFVGDIIETQAPTATPNLCQDLSPGDIQIILVNSDDPDQIGFFTLDNIRHGVGTIYVTDRPWNGTNFLENGEGTIAVRLVGIECSHAKDNKLTHTLPVTLLYSSPFHPRRSVRMAFATAFVPVHSCRMAFSRTKDFGSRTGRETLVWV